MNTTDEVETIEPFDSHRDSFNLETEVSALRKQGFSAKDMSRNFKLRGYRVNYKKIVEALQFVDEHIAIDKMSPLQRAAEAIHAKRAALLAKVYEKVHQLEPQDPRDLDDLQNILEGLSSRSPYVGLERALEYLEDSLGAVDYLAFKLEKEALWPTDTKAGE